MGKKMFATLIVAVVAMFAGYNVYQSQNTVVLSELALANVEALANDEGDGGGGNSVTCYSSSESKSGATYYDCGGCTKQFNSKGTGSSSTCTSR